MKFSIIVAILFSIQPTWAQFHLEKVIHSDDKASGVEQSQTDEDNVSSIDEDELERQAPASVDDALRQAPGATTARGPRNSSESIQIRGLDTSKIFIMIDGARQNFRSGHSSMIPVELENLKAVEIYESSSDLSKGNSLGGGIQFVTKDAQDYLQKNKDFGAEFRYQNNSSSAENIYNAKSIFKTSEFSGLISLTAQSAGNIQLNNGETLANSAYEDFIGLIKLKRGEWSFSHESFNREDNNPLDPSLNPPDSIQSLQADTKITKETTIVKHQTDDLLVNAYYNHFETEKTERESKTKEHRTINTLGMSFKKKLDKMRFGAEGFQDSLESDKEGSELTSFPKAQSLNVSSYLERDFDYKDITATPGLRLNYYSMEDAGDNFSSKSAQEISKKLKLKYSFE
ncbi:MAG: TonB-dependent receptor plug domain-containing protein, partial [Bacteriovoracaceae bacterium]|nr:TonB-dependent receptor plug domain-containing protein [Bacteriovoracaceae bacterium]